MSMFPTTASDASDLESLRNTLVNETKDAQPTGNVDFLTFSGKGRKGEFIFGREKEDILGETGIVVNSWSFCHGWTLFIAKKPVVNINVSIAKPLPHEPDAQEETLGPDKGKMRRPQKSKSFQAQFLDAEPGANPILFSSCSMGGTQAVSELIFAVKVKAAQGSDYLFPIITLDDAPWANDNRRPVFTITGWVDQNGNKESDSQLPHKVSETVSEPELEKESSEKPVTVKRRRRV